MTKRDRKWHREKRTPMGFTYYLECRKWGFKRWGFEEIRGYLRKKGLFPPFSGFSRCSSHRPEKGEKGRKRAKKKKQFRPISGKGGQTPFKPPFPWSSFPCLFGKRQGKPPKRQGFLMLAEPLKSLGKKGKTLKIARNSLKRKKARKSKKARKRRLGLLHPHLRQPKLRTRKKWGSVFGFCWVRSSRRPRGFRQDSSEVIQEPLPLKPGILVKKSVVLVKRKNGFTKTHPLDRKPWKRKEKSVLLNPFSRFTKTTEFFTKILGLKGRGS